MFTHYVWGLLRVCQYLRFLFSCSDANGGVFASAERSREGTKKKKRRNFFRMYFTNSKNWNAWSGWMVYSNLGIILLPSEHILLLGNVLKLFSPPMMQYLASMFTFRIASFSFHIFIVF